MKVKYFGGIYQQLIIQCLAIACKGIKIIYEPRRVFKSWVIFPWWSCWFDVNLSNYTKVLSNKCTFPPRHDTSRCVLITKNVLRCYNCCSYWLWPILSMFGASGALSVISLIWLRSMDQYPRHQQIYNIYLH